MVALDQKIAVWVMAAVAAYIIYRLFSAKEPSLTRYEREMDEILTSEKYKVKGRFED